LAFCCRFLVAASERRCRGRVNVQRPQRAARGTTLTPARPGVDSAGRGSPGEPVTYRGNQITIDDVVFLPTPVQRPRVPVWVGGFWPNKAPMRRAARWDGAIPAMAGMEAARPPDVSEVRDLVMLLRGCRAENGLADRQFDIVIGGMSLGGTAGRDLC